MNKELKKSITEYADLFNIEPAALMAFVEVETGGQGFDTSTGKLLIQFEPKWFDRIAGRKLKYLPSGKWSVNGVERQSKEWEAFNSAFAIDPVSAMEATSIGVGQIMGFHWAKLGYNSVGEMWDEAKLGIKEQVYQMCLFIKATYGLHPALIRKDWHRVASLYNGSKYRELAAKLGREPYDESMAKAYKKYSV